MEVKENDQLQNLCPLPISGSQSPWLLISDYKKKDMLTCYNFKEGRSYSRRFVGFHKMRVAWMCCDGWVVLENKDKKENFCLFNLMTMEKLQIPRLDKLEMMRNCFLTAPPTDKSCRIIFIDGWGNGLLHCRPTETKYKIEDNGFLNGPVYASTIFQGKIYALGVVCELVVVDFTDLSKYKVLWTSDGMTKPLKSPNCTTYFLVECGSELLLVHRIVRGFNNVEVLDYVIFSASFSKGAWVKKGNLGDHAIFLSKAQGFSCDAVKFGVKKNCIYYTRGYDRNIHVFDLEDKSITPLRTTSSDFSSHSSLFWLFMPN